MLTKLIYEAIIILEIILLKYWTKIQYALSLEFVIMLERKFVCLVNHNISYQTVHIYFKVHIS